MQYIPDLDGYYLGPQVKLLRSVGESYGLMTHALNVIANPVKDLDLREGLRAFWELESLGISKNDKSVYDIFCEQLKFKNGTYEVSLRWKQPRLDLPNNYHTSVKRLNGLLKRLRQDTETFQEYDKVIRDQIQ